MIEALLFALAAFPFLSLVLHAADKGSRKLQTPRSKFNQEHFWGKAYTEFIISSCYLLRSEEEVPLCVRMNRQAYGEMTRYMNACSMDSDFPKQPATAMGWPIKLDETTIVSVERAT